MSGRLDLAFAADGDGRTYLQRQYASYPFHVCRVHYHDKDHPGLATLYVQSCSGGIYEDDRLDLTLATAQGAEAHVSTQAATVVHSMPSGSASQRVRIQCEGGSYLEYLPDPQILFPGSRCQIGDCRQAQRRCRCARFGLVPLATIPRDETTCSQPISARSSSRTRPARPRHRPLEDRRTGFSRFMPGISGRFTAQGTMIVAGLDFAATAVADELQKIRLDRDEAVIGSSQLPNSAGLLVRVLAADGAALKLALHQAWCAARVILKGSMPVERRK